MAQDIFETVRGLPKTPYISPAEMKVAPEKVLIVDMGQAAVTSPQSVRPVLATFALATCIGVAVHNPRTKDTGLTHLVVDSEDYDTLSRQSDFVLRRMIDAVRGDVQAPIEARIIGPHMGDSRALMQEIIGKLHEGGARIISADFGAKGGPRSFAVDPASWDKGLLRGSIDSVDIRDTTPEAIHAQARQSHAFIEDLNFNPPGISYDNNGFLDFREPREGVQPWQSLTP